MTEAELVKRAKRGDVDAFAKLYEQIYIRLYQFALYTLGNSHDAEDAVSETVTDCFEQIKSLRRDEAFSAYEWTDEGFKQVLKTELDTNSSYTVRGLYSGDYLYVVNTSGSYDDNVIVSSYDMGDKYREVDSLTVP